MDASERRDAVGRVAVAALVGGLLWLWPDLFAAVVGGVGVAWGVKGRA